MTRTARVRLVPVVLAATLGLGTLTGCGSGIFAQTSQPYSPTQGSTTEIGPIHVTDVVVIASADGDLAEVHAAFVNNDEVPDALTGVAVSDSSPVTLPDGPVVVRQYENVVIGPGGTRVFVHDMKGKVGEVARVTFTFRDAGEATVDAIIADEQDLVAGS